VIHRPSYLNLKMFGKKWGSSSSIDDDDYNGLTSSHSPYRDFKSLSSSFSSSYTFNNIFTETDDVNIVLEPLFTLNKSVIVMIILLLVVFYAFSVSSYCYHYLLMIVVLFFILSLFNNIVSSRS
jgi:hypothetical protein